MLNFCPKCRSFYSDADLRFCLNDGVPLIAVSENENLRREGEDFIRRAERRIERETFRKQIRKIVSITITTTLTILVISVITINSWLYLNPETMETAKNETIQPEPQPTVQVSAEPEPSVEVPAETGSTNGEPSPEITGTPTPEPSPTSESFPSPSSPPTIKIINTPLPPPTETPVSIPITTPTPIFVPTITPTPLPVEAPISTPITPEKICTQQEKTQAISFIKQRYSETWRKGILNQKEPLQNEIASANDLSFDQISVKLNFSPENISVSISSDCQKAAVNIYVLWTVQANAPDVKIRVVPPRRNSVLPYRCEKAGSSWSCG